MSSWVSDDSAGQERSKGETGAPFVEVVTLTPHKHSWFKHKELASDLPCPGPNIILQMPGPGLAPGRQVSDVKC